MNRKRVIPRQHRRYSLPATPTQLPVMHGFNKRIPEGSDIFQQALEELCANEPNHAPAKPTVNTFGEFGYNGLNNIQELNESEYAESEEEEETISAEEDARLRTNSGRRHSTPTYFPDRPDSDAPDAKGSSADAVVKNIARLRKEYFIKHGHWPVSNGAKTHRPSLYVGKKSQTLGKSKK